MSDMFMIEMYLLACSKNVTCL